MAGFTDEQLSAAADAYRAYGTERAAADALGMAISTYKDRLRAAARKGMMG
jgi:hypothetical protein